MTLVLVLLQSGHDLEREAELRAYAVLGSEDIPALEPLVDLAARLTGMAVCEINVVSTDDVVHVATTNRDHLRVPREYSFCSPVISYDAETYVVTDASTELPFATSPYVTGEKASIRSYAAARLVAPGSGITFGTICVFDEAFRAITTEQLEALETLAASVVEVLEMRRSERALAETLARLVGSHRELHSSNESLEAFAGQISHDLQSPLTSVSLALELLEEEVGDSAQVRMLLDHALSGSRRMHRTITDLLDFAVAGAGSPAVRVDLDDAVAEVLVDLRASAGDARIEVDPLPAVLAHPTEVRAVLQNLVANAVKFAAPLGVAQVRITGEPVGDRIRVTVVDNGPGIPEHQRESVFDLNVRGDTTLPGYGIGLATCARIVRAREGRIGVDPAPSGGSAFWFELPAA